VQELTRELKRVCPDAVPVRIGKHEVYLYHNVTPAHTYEVIIQLIDGQQLLELTARDSFDAPLAEFILDRLTDLEMPPRESMNIGVFPIEFPAPWQFNCVVVAPPEVAGRFDNQSELLKSMTYWAFPAFEGEFKHGDKGKAFWRQIGRKDGWRSDVIRWSRLPKTEKTFD